MKSPLGRSYCCPTEVTTPAMAIQWVCGVEGLDMETQQWRVEQAGRPLPSHALASPFSSHATLTISPAGGLLGGKGGFGSLLRAIGAQIEKTTNHEAMRDLGGRRQRDVNNEKRLKDYVARAGEREREERDKKEAKLEKLRRLAARENKHEFVDVQYDKERSQTEEKVHDAMEAAMKVVSEVKADTGKIGEKRKGEREEAAEPSRKKNWMDAGLEGLSGSDLSDSSEDEGEASNAVSATK